jgi:NAD-dependent dihydropyrimidine dehydrogenase PreA subunit
MACLTEEMEAWLADRRPDLVAELKAKADEMWMPIEKTTCILCNTPMDVCSYCFTEHILQWLEQYPRLVPEFAKLFNYDLNRKGYATELVEVVQ